MYNIMFTFWNDKKNGLCKYSQIGIQNAEHNAWLIYKDLIRQRVMAA